MSKSDVTEKEAMELYKPPFKHMHGYIFDADNNMVADDNDTLHRELSEGNKFAIQRVRGWGRLGYLENPGQKQDKIGDIIAKALTEYWDNNNG